MLREQTTQVRLNSPRKGIQSICSTLVRLFVRNWRIRSHSSGRVVLLASWAIFICKNDTTDVWSIAGKRPRQASTNRYEAFDSCGSNQTIECAHKSLVVDGIEGRMFFLEKEQKYGTIKGTNNQTNAAASWKGIAVSLLTCPRQQYASTCQAHARSQLTHASTCYRLLEKLSKE